jgi:hypothetical protein
MRSEGAVVLLEAEERALFGAREQSLAIYQRLRERLAGSPAAVEVKQTCIHLVAGTGGTAFAGVHPRKQAVLLNLRLATALEGPRIRRVEQASRNRYHNELLIESPDAVDGELLGWMEDALQLASTR